MRDARRPPRPRRQVCGLCTLGAALYLAALLAIERLLPERNHLAVVLLYLPQLLLLIPLLPTLFLCAVARRWCLLGANLALLMVGGALLMPPTLARHRPADDAARRLRIVSWNMHEEVASAPRMAQVLSALRPDIICLQESRNAAFANALPGMQVAHTHEVTTISRGKIVEQRALMLGPSPNYRWGMDTEILLPQGRIRVLNVHYMIDVLGRMEQITNLKGKKRTFFTRKARDLEQQVVLKWLGETDGARAVVGDFNTPPNALFYRQLALRAVDAFGAVGRGWGFTYRRDLPLIRIDYVWCAGGLQPLRAFTADGAVSDHRLLVTDLLLPPEAKDPASPHRPWPAAPVPVETGPEDTR